MSAGQSASGTKAKIRWEEKSNAPSSVCAACVSFRAIRNRFVLRFSIATGPTSPGHEQSRRCKGVRVRGQCNCDLGVVRPAPGLRAQTAKRPLETRRLSCEETYSLRSPLAFTPVGKRIAAQHLPAHSLLSLEAPKQCVAVDRLRQVVEPIRLANAPVRSERLRVVALVEQSSAAVRAEPVANNPHRTGGR